MPVGMLCINVNISDYEYIETTLKRILGIKERKDVELSWIIQLRFYLHL